MYMYTVYSLATKSTHVATVTWPSGDVTLTAALTGLLVAATVSVCTRRHALAHWKQIYFRIKLIIIFQEYAQDVDIKGDKEGDFHIW